MAQKDVYLILAFHAHEPWWDLPSHILSRLDDDEMRNSVPADNWVRKRAQAERDIYGQLIALSAKLNAPVCLEATNELLMQTDEFMPDTFEQLKRAFGTRSLYPIYGGAHHAHCTLLNVDEVADELRLNQEFIHDVMGAPLPRYKGAFPMEGSVDARKLDAFARMGIDYLVFPNLSPRKAHYRFDTPAKPPYEPFALDHGLIGLPRHFSVSQDIWRPITRWKPVGLRHQGYILGLYPVFDQEYREALHVSFPISRDEAIDEYRRVVERAVEEAPDAGLLLYIQDLELMDYGDEALEILGEALPAIHLPNAQLHIVNPDEYIDKAGVRERELPRLRFYQVSWAPEIRPVLRADGHYPPLDAGPVRGLDFSLEGFRRWPFILWEWGRWHVDVFNSLIASFGQSLVVSLSASEWHERAYKTNRLNTGEQIALFSRTMKQADNWGWQPDEERQKRPYLYGMAIIDLLLTQLNDAPSVATNVEPFDQRSIDGLAWLLTPFVDVRVDYLRKGIKKLGSRAGEHAAWAHKHLVLAEDRRRLAAGTLEEVRAANDALPSNQAGVAALLSALRAHCRHVFLATDHIQRAWASIADTDALVTEMYIYLYELYPPLLFKQLRQLAPPGELATIEDPPLL